jgi:hypothetical protein
MRNVNQPIDDDDVTRRLHDLDMHINHAVAADRDDPELVAAFRHAVLCRLARLNQRGGSMARIRGYLAIRASGTKLAVVALGVFAVILGAVLMVLAPSPSSPMMPPVAHLSTPTQGTVDDVPESPTLAHPNGPPKSQFFWQGRVTITADGVNFDTAPPSGAAGGGVYVKDPGPQASTSVVDSAEGVLLVLAPTSDIVEKKDCIEAIDAAALPAVPPLMVARGIGYCFRTLGRRIGLMRFIETDPEPGHEMEVMAFVWN